jgi:hypothetical protein
MTNRIYRDVVRVVRDAGGSHVEVNNEGRGHARVYFTNPAGERHWIPFHRSSNGKRYEDAFRSEVRRRGLNPRRRWRV